MARGRVGRWAAAVAVLMAVTVFPAHAGALEARVGAQLPPLPVQLPVPLPTEVTVTLPPALPELPLVGGDRPARSPGTSTTPQPRSVPPDNRPTAPAPVPAPAPAPAAGRAGPTSLPSPNALSGGGEHTWPDPVREVIRTAARFSLPLGLTAAVIVFLSVQALVDRRDPKLAVAPIEDEVFGFQ